MKNKSFRKISLLGFLACLGLLGFGLYLELGEGIEPCPLCILQRITFLLLAVIFLISALHNPKEVGRNVYNVLIFIVSCFGIYLSFRQLWLQTHPLSVEVCAPSFNYMWNNWPFSQVLVTMFRGTSDCAEVSWTLLGLSMPSWSLIWFVIFALVAPVQWIMSKVTRD